MLPLLTLAAVTAVLDPVPVMTGNCNPTRVHFTGHIASDIAGKVTYTWLRANKPAGQTLTVNFDKPGSVPVSYDLMIRKPEDGSVMLRVVLPQQNDSARVKFHVTCK
ncbi:MAG TPA: hypothetical protein VNV86_04365 [Candidatus Acidoferrum sp.]|nr:hypothetical protein [Candidatus Acidoferrum sp.]